MILCQEQSSPEAGTQSVPDSASLPSPDSASLPSLPSSLIVEVSRGPFSCVKERVGWSLQDGGKCSITSRGPLAGCWRGSQLLCGLGKGSEASPCWFVLSLGEKSIHD